MNECREESGVFNRRILYLRNFPDRFFSYFRMLPETFDKLLTIIKNDISKQVTFMRQPILPELRLAVTLHHLAEGSSHSSIATHYGLGRSTISSIIYETCDALWNRLQPQHMCIPTSHAGWRLISQGFSEKWNFPNCIGAIDGKHILVQAPNNSGSEYFNYKRTFSVHLMAVVDSCYRFIVVDVGQKGSASDSGVFERSLFGQAYLANQVNVPPPAELPGTVLLAPYVIVGDEGYPLRQNLMRPFPGRDLNTIEKKRYNYRLSRARRVSENAFGILCQRWRVFFKPIQADGEKAAKLVKAGCVLHNFLTDIGDGNYMPVGFADVLQDDGNIRPGSWRIEGEFTAWAQPRIPGLNHTREATNVRNLFLDYFSSEAGRVSWQDDQINRR